MHEESSDEIWDKWEDLIGGDCDYFDSIDLFDGPKNGVCFSFCNMPTPQEALVKSLEILNTSGWPSNR